MDEKGTLLTVRQLRDLLQVDRITIYRMLSDGRLQGFKVGGQWRFERQAIEGWLHEQQASLVPSKADDAPRPSPEALPLSCIRAIQEIVAQALGVGAVTTTTDGIPLTPVANGSRFCELVLNSDAGRQRCIGSWRTSAAEQGNSLRPFTCHAGLRFLAGRIQVQGRSVAAAHAGQYLDRPPAGEDWSARLRELAAACGLEAGELRLALDRVPVLDRDRQLTLLRLFQQMLLTFAEIGEERLNLLGRLQRIAEITQF
jgi:excisionase family DNA binding protein